MDRYIGMDVHASSCTMAVVSGRGKRIRDTVVETNGQALVEAVKLVPGTKRMVIEEGTHSNWLHELLSPHVEEFVVVGVGLQRGQKNDRLDAYRLAEQLRTGALPTQVYKAPKEFKRLRELARGHRMLVVDTVRVKNRIRAVYRSHGISVPGQFIYNAEFRHDTLEQLPVHCRDLAALLMTQHDQLLEVKKVSETLMVAESKRYAITKILRTCPGLGDIRVARLVPIVVSPHRFRTTRQFWSYCGLGIVMRTSSDWTQTQGKGWERAEVQRTRGLNRNHNHVLKDVFKGAALTVLQSERYPELRAYYQRQCDGGTKPTLAKVSLARKVAAIALAMWKKQEVYDPAKYAQR